MTGETVILFPKYTSLCSKSGGVSYVSDPFDATGHKSIVAELNFVSAVGGATTVTGDLEQSSDLKTWSAVTGGGLAPSVGGMDRAVVSGTVRYVRLKVTVSGGGARMVVVWAKAVARVR